MRMVGKVFRPPSEGRSLLLQGTIGCSWNQCAYCDMYSDKPKFRIRDIHEALADLRNAGEWARRDPTARRVEKLFVTDGDAFSMPLTHWEPILSTAAEEFPDLRQVSCYAMARNFKGKTDIELRRLRELGLSLLYIGPESGDDRTMFRLAKGSDFAGHQAAAERAHAAGMRLSAIFLLGAGGTDRSREHAEGSARLATAMDPEYLSALTLTVLPGTPIHRKQERGKFTLPGVTDMLGELRTIVADARPTRSVFRSNHASNYLPTDGVLPDDRERIVATIDAAVRGDVPLKQEHQRGL